MTTEMLIPPWARDDIRRLCEIQRIFDTAADGTPGIDPLALFLEHCAIYRRLRAAGLTELQIESAIYNLNRPD